MKSSRYAISELHWPLLLVALCIGALGVYNLHSAASSHEPDLYTTQLAWLGIGLAVAAVLVIVDYRMTESLAYAVYAVCCLMLLAVLFQGKIAGGAQRWLRAGPVTLQPSELAKLATVLCLARYFARREGAGTYSLGDLLRPLNPSRPLAVLTFIAWGWERAALSDPIGAVARAVRGRLGAAEPTLADLWWFRALLLLLLVAMLALCVIWIVRTEKARALLDPWPPQRRKRLIVLCVTLVIVLGVALGFSWHHPWVRDPLGVALATLYRGAAADGRWSELHPSLALRGSLLAAATVYLLASLASLRSGVVSWSDTLIAPIDLLAVPALLVLVEPDLGTAGLIVLVGMSMFLIVGVQGRSLVTMGLLGALVAGVGWFGVLKDYQKSRILTFLDPEHDLMGAGWNAVQSLIAVGSGRWLGKGHMGGTQSQLSFLPEQHTDFAFSVWAEEQGFVGCVIVLALYLMLLLMTLLIAANARDTYGTLLAAGVAALVFWQAFINVGMVIGMLPVVGLPLPLFSYGGSSVLTVMAAVGLVVGIHWRRRGAQTAGHDLPPV